MYKWIQNGKTSEIQKLTHPSKCVFVSLMQFYQFTSGARSHSRPSRPQISEQLLLRYKAGTHSFWFSGTQPGASAELRGHRMHPEQGFHRITGHKARINRFTSELYYRMGGGRGLHMNHIAAVNDYFLFLVSGVVGRDLLSRTLLFLSLTINI